MCYKLVSSGQQSWHAKAEETRAMCVRAWKSLIYRLKFNLWAVRKLLRNLWQGCNTDISGKVQQWPFGGRISKDGSGDPESNCKTAKVMELRANTRQRVSSALLTTYVINRHCRTSQESILFSNYLSLSLVLSTSACFLPILLLQAAHE